MFTGNYEENVELLFYKNVNPFPRFNWSKTHDFHFFFQQVLGLIIFPLCITYNEKGGIYVTNTTRSLNFTVKYPFEYNNETIVFTGEDNPVGNFNFDPAIEACVKLFVGVSVVSCFAAVTTLIVGCVVHRNEDKANKVLIAVSTLLFFDSKFGNQIRFEVNIH